MNKVSSAWIFVSHSVKDLLRVREIRNELETRNANPILFFLKAVSEDDELDQLIKREIEARNFFLLCDSPNSRASPWVRREVEFVKSLGRRKRIRIASVDLEAPADEQRVAIDGLLREATIHVAFAEADRERVRPYLDWLAFGDYSVFAFEDFDPGRDWGTGITDRLVNSTFAVLFLSEASGHSRYLAEEVRMLRSLSKRIIPIALDPPPFPRVFQALFMDYQVVDFWSDGVEGNLRALARIIDAVGIGRPA